MPQFRLNITTKQKGAIFAASATKAAGARAVVNINEALALEAVRRVGDLLSVVLKNPTGYYESNITVLRGSTYRGVWDSNVVYGGWLEGTSNRNRTTRFKGYHTFRKVRQSMAQDTVRLAQPMVDRYVREMNGQ